MLPKKIKQEVDNYYGIDICKRSRKQYYVFARFMYFKLCTTITSDSMSYIGKLANRDRCTVLYGSKEIENVFNHQPKYKQDFDILYNRLLNRKKRPHHQKRSDALELAMHYRKKYLKLKNIVVV